MSRKPEEFKKQSFFRLLKYTKPYKGRLIIGILAGFLVGGSIFGVLMMAPQLVSAIEDRTTTSDKAVEESQEKVLEVIDDANLSKQQKTAAIHKIYNPETSEKVSKELKKIKKYAEQYKLPITVNKHSITWDKGFELTIPVEDELGKMSWQFFTIYVIVFVFAWAMKNLFTYVNRYYTRWVGTRVVADLRNEIFQKLIGQSLKFYGQIDVGQLISRCTNETSAIESAVANTIADATRCPLEILACGISIFIFCREFNDYSLPIILFIGLPLSILPIIIISRRIRKIYKKSFAKIADVVSRMHEVFTGILIVKSYNTEEKENIRFKRENRKYFRTVVGALKMELLMAPLMEVVAVAASLAFFIYSYSQGVTLTQISGLLFPAFLAYQPIKKIAKISTYLQRSMAAADRYFNMIDIDTAIKESPNARPLKSFENEIVFNDVTFSYEPSRKILDDIDLKIPKGHVVAVVGETGSGKTTIASLIARFYDVDSGSVTIDKHDVREIQTKSLREHIGIVTQDAILFNDTIANNIAYGCPGVTREQVIEAAKQANAHDFIVGGRHKDGYDSIVGDKGRNLSGGEKQRVAIARAILKNPPILILDEATSALDTVTERLVQEALNRVMSNRTVFAIAHRLSTIKHADQIIVLDKGKIIERGTHDELLKHGGRYKILHDHQFDMGQPRKDDEAEEA